MKNYTRDVHKRLSYGKPQPHPDIVKASLSNSSIAESALHGTSVTPSGLSGMLRRLAFSYSGSNFGQWFPLIFSYRTNIWKGLVKDYRNGLIPEISELKNNKTRFTRRAVKAVVTILVFEWITGGLKKKKRKV